MVTICAACVDSGGLEAAATAATFVPSETLTGQAPATAAATP
jgi:hypothetical protein